MTVPELEKLPLGPVVTDASLPHTDGIDINENGTIYWIKNQTKHGYPSLEVYNSWHLDNNFSDVVLANFADLVLPVGEVVQMRMIQK